MEKKLFKIKRGIFFSGDALIAVLIIFTIVAVLFVVKKDVRIETEVHQDILNSLTALKIGEVNNSYVQDVLIPSGIIEDLNSSILEQIGEFYVTNESIARELAFEVLKELNFNVNVGIWFGTTLIYASNTSAIESATDIETTRQLLSGIEQGESVRGFSARAFLTSGMLNDYFYFGGYVGEGNISFLAPYSGNISSAKLELVVNKDFELFVNGDSLGMFNKSVSDVVPVGYTISTDEFVSGNNLVEIKGDGNLHIAGGFLKITYEADLDYAFPERYRFPGIDGIINLYDGFYVPGNLVGMEIFLHLNTSSRAYLNIGNVTVFNQSTSGEETISIDNFTLSSILNYGELSEKTVPLRLGLENVSFSLTMEIDVFSVSDLSKTMKCSVPLPESCHASENQCNNCGGNWMEPLENSKTANRLFVDEMLRYSGNKFGLVGYKASSAASNFHELSNDSVSLNQEIDIWSPGGQKCICCGINKAVQEYIDNSEEGRIKVMAVMSSGTAQIECSEQGVTADLNGNGEEDDAGDDAIQAVCDAYENYGITTYSVGYGEGADEATLQAMANCGNGSYYYSDITELLEIYQQIVQEIVGRYAEQTLEIDGDLDTELYSDSYIEFEYIKPSVPGGMVLTFESQFSNASAGTFDVPGEGIVLETRVTSYSGVKWTDKVGINNVLVYNLANYGGSYINLGDPYNVNIPNSEVVYGTNNISLTTGTSPGNGSEGSLYNKIIYTIIQNISSFSPILPFAEGCEWTIEFEDGFILVKTIPDSYTGDYKCVYNETTGEAGELANSDDSLQVAVLGLLQDLDVNNDGIVDFLFEESDLDISLEEVVGIPYAWTTEVQVRVWY